MDDHKSLKIKLKEILDNKKFELLEPFQDSSTWKSMSGDERELLSILFLKSGENQLKNGEEKALYDLEKATQLSPKNPKIFYRKALAFASQDNNPKSMKEALKSLKEATNLSNDYFDAWHAWGNVLVKFSTLTGKSHYLEEANLKFLKAENSITKQNSHRVGQLYRHWGICWYLLGKTSGEAYEYSVSVEKFKEAQKYGAEGPEFWNDFSNALMALSCLISKQEYFFEAIELYWKAVKVNPNYAEGWVNLAFSFQALYEVKGQDVYYKLANDSFIEASRLDSQNVSLWMRWGLLLLAHSKKKRDSKVLLESFSKFEAADLIEQNHPVIMSSWAEAMLDYAVITEQLLYMKEAEKKILSCLEIQPDNHELWCLYGQCLLEQGRYFHDEEFFLNSIQQFQFGLSQQRQNYKLWYGIAIAYFSIGEIRQDVTLLEKAEKLFARVMEYGGHDDSRIWNDWGVCHLKLAILTLEKYYAESAVEKFEQAILLSNKEGVKLDPEWLYNYGCAVDILGDYEDDPEHYERAIQAFKQTLKLDRKFDSAHYNLALSYAHLGEITTEIDHFYKAFEHFHSAVTQDPEDDCSWNEWGVTLINLSQLIHDVAKTDLSNNLSTEGEKKLLYAAALGNVHSFYNLACYYSLMDNISLSLHYLEKAEEQNALPPIDDLLHDDWLANLRETQEFQKFIALIFKHKG